MSCFVCLISFTSNSRPAQKLFSELIREAHVSLHRCNLDKLGIDKGPEQSNLKSTALKSNEQDDPRRKQKIEETVPKSKVRDNKDSLNLLNSKDNVRTDCSQISDDVAAPAGSQFSSMDSDNQHKPQAPSEVKAKQQKRPLPLPALALFLKQHSSKSIMAKKKLDSPLPALPSECLSDSQSPPAAPECRPSDRGNKATHPPKDLEGDITKSQTLASGPTGAPLHPDEVVLNVTGPAAETARKTSSPDAVSTTDPEGLGLDHFLTCDSVAESISPELAVPDGTTVLPHSDQSLCILGTSLSNGPSSLAVSPISLSPFNTVLPAPNYTLPSDSPRSDSLLLDPECSSFGFEPLSPASSPEPLTYLPLSFALELDTTPSESTPHAVSPEELQPSEDLSVFKWHTVLPPPEPYVDPSFTTFQPVPQNLPLDSVTSPLLPLQALSPSEPQTLDPSTPPPDPVPSFQDNEPPLLPFPAELSPLALQMALSPTFSSLDGDGLSPTPSIADLVHFFSTNDDLGMGVEFSNTDVVAVPCPPVPSTVEADAQEPSQQGALIAANKPCRYKKSRRRKFADQEEKKMAASTYTTMQPNLEEVEEQLFISFTSKVCNLTPLV